MFFELVGTVLAGVAAGLLVWALARFSKRGVPGWLVPVAAGLAMLAATISNEYSWYSRTTATLPEGLVIAEEIERKAIYRPWTYVRPFVSQFMAVDVAGVRTHAQAPDQKMVDVLVFGRWSVTQKLVMLVDCAEQRRVWLRGVPEFGPDGQIKVDTWDPPLAEDPILRTTCETS